MHITVELLNESHLDALAALEAECFSEPWSRAQLAEECTNPQATVYVATADGAVLGYAGMHHILDEGYINNVAVFPQYRRAGVARRLMDALNGYCAAHQMAFLTLEVRASNEAAIALYTRCGFQPVGRRKRFYSAPTEDALLMTHFYGGSPST